MVKWIKVRKKEKWIVPAFPFFGLVITKDFRYTFSKEQEYETEGYWFRTLSEAKRYAEKKQLERCEEDINLFEYSEYPVNVAAGAYWKNLEWKKYHWLFAGKIHTSYLYNQFAIRFDRSVTVRDMLIFGQKIQKRHYQRFLKLFNNQQV